MNGVPARGGPPLSPCIKVCVLDEAGQYCLGCRRTTSEIAQWWGMRDDEKRAVLAALPHRAAGDERNRAGG